MADENTDNAGTGSSEPTSKRDVDRFKKTMKIPGPGTAGASEPPPVRGPETIKMKLSSASKDGPSAPAVRPVAAPKVSPPSSGDSSETMRVAIPTPAPPAAESTENTKKAAPAPQINPATTMRIDLPPKTGRQDKAPPVKPNLSPSSTINLKPILPKPATAPGVAVGVPTASGGAAKKDTSKIPLDAAIATPTVGGPKKPKTIRIKPTVPSAATAGGPPKDAKRETSRISLEAALGGDEGAPDAPRTIKLKRPSEAPTVKAKPKPMSQTAQLDVPAEETKGSPTQKKTIKVKRPSEKRVVAAPSSAASDWPRR